jgi:hypothetical protein
MLSIENWQLQSTLIRTNPALELPLFVTALCDRT